MKRNFAEKLMGMSESSWERHANPLSVYSRIFSFPFFAFAFWSYHIWGLVPAIIFAFLVSFWIWMNPRVFGIPKTTNNWASKVTFGERIWLRHDRNDLPKWHSRLFINTLLGVSGLGFFGMAYFTYIKDFGMFLFFSSLCFFGKTWYCDRMAWLYEDMKSRKGYSEWLRS